MISHGIIANILRAMLFAGICSVVFLVLSMMASYSIDSTDIDLSTLQERISEKISQTSFDAIPDINLNILISSMADPNLRSNLGIRVTIEDVEKPLFFNEDYFNANYGSGSGIKANIRSRSANRLVTTADGENVLVTVDMVGSRI